MGARGRLAQLVERLVYTEMVGGSSPSSPTTMSDAQHRPDGFDHDPIGRRGKDRGEDVHGNLANDPGGDAFPDKIAQPENTPGQAEGRIPAFFGVGAGGGFGVLGASKDELVLDLADQGGDMGGVVPFPVLGRDQGDAFLPLPVQRLATPRADPPAAPEVPGFRGLGPAGKEGFFRPGECLRRSIGPERERAAIAPSLQRPEIAANRPPRSRLAGGSLLISSAFIASPCPTPGPQAIP